MISLSGLPALTALRIVDATRDDAVSIMRSRPEHARAITAFRDRAGDLSTARDLTEDHAVYVVAMRAFDLEDQIFGKGMMRKVLGSDGSDDGALVNRLSDPRFRTMHAAMGFGEGDRPQMVSPLAREAVIDRYLDRQVLGEIEADNPAVAAALRFREGAPSIDTAFDILKDPDLSAVLRTALGLPAASAGIDIDKQAAEIERRVDLSTLSDPAVVDRLVRKYLVLSDVASGASVASSGALQILSGAQSGGLLDIAAVFASTRNGYAR